jgi:hypothetical protein
VGIHTASNPDSNLNQGKLPVVNLNCVVNKEFHFDAVCWNFGLSGQMHAQSCTCSLQMTASVSGFRLPARTSNKLTPPQTRLYSQAKSDSPRCCEAMVDLAISTPRHGLAVRLNPTVQSSSKGDCLPCHFKRTSASSHSLCNIAWIPPQPPSPS